MGPMARGGFQQGPQRWAYIFVKEIFRFLLSGMLTSRPPPEDRCSPPPLVAVGAGIPPPWMWVCPSPGSSIIIDFPLWLCPTPNYPLIFLDFH